LSHLDRLVTVDTAVAHLAGAMGVPCILIAPLNGEWRWGTEGDKTPWYESVTVVRAKDWGDAVDQVCALLPDYLPMPKVERATVVPEKNGKPESVARKRRPKAETNGKVEEKVTI
jgi:ADP-heptose:LPS heptosyltransferase